MDTLAAQYTVSLTDYLSDQLVHNPPTIAVSGTDTEIIGGLVHLGKYQDDPTEYTFVATVHEGGPTNVTKTGHQTWRHEEYDKMEREMVGGDTCISYWKYKYTVKIDYFMVDSGENQEEARRKGMLVAQWFRYKVQQATPSTLGLSKSDFGEIALEQRPIALEMIEGGGPDSYIEKALLFIEQLVMNGS